MDLSIHNQILWNACKLSEARLGSNAIARPTAYFPLLVRGSWINDTNQVTAFTDYFSNPSTATEQPESPLVRPATVVRGFLSDYWKLELGKLFERMSQLDDDNLKEESRRLAEPFHHTDDFGSYSAHDHLDVLTENTAVEYRDREKGLVSAYTVENALSFLRLRLRHSTFEFPDAAARKSPLQVSSLGRALHTIQDFFAHTNYVELLLWKLAKHGPGEGLDREVVDFFNHSHKHYPFEPGLGAGIYTPLPTRKDEFPRPEADSALRPALWYGESPELTPLASCVFDSQDTAYSLLGVYAHYLEKLRPQLTTHETLDLLFSIIDVSGTPMSREALKLLIEGPMAIKRVFREFGRGARRFLVSAVLDIAKEKRLPESALVLLQTASGLLERYDSKKAAEWARAGQVKYVAHAVREDLAERLAISIMKGEPALPHHSLLSKDHPPDRRDERVRFGLACYFATEVSARVLEWHFSATPPPLDRYAVLREKYLVHPGKQFEGSTPVFDMKKMSLLARRFFDGDWTGLLSPGQPLLTVDV